MADLGVPGDRVEQDKPDFGVTASGGTSLCERGPDRGKVNRGRRSARPAVVTAVVIGMALLGGSAVPASQAATASQAAGSQSAASFIAGYFHAVDHALMPGRAGAPVARPAALYLSSFFPAARQAQRMLAYEIGTADGFHMWVRGHGDIYMSINTRLTIRSLKVSATGKRAVAIVEAVTTMRWSPGTGPTVTRFTRAKAASMAAAAKHGRVFGPGSAVTSMVAASHRMLLIRQGGTWTLQYDYYIDPFNQGLAADHTSPRVEGQAVPVAMGSRVSGVSKAPAYATEDYSPSGAAQYADQYWHNYNPAFWSYANSGGDCTNFVSQSLNDSWSGHTSGFLYNDYWNWYYYYYDSSGYHVSPSLDWINANALHTYVGANPHGSAYNIGWHGAAGSYSAVKSYDISSMHIGDLHFYHWSGDTAGVNHAAIAVAYLSDGETLVDAHTNDEFHIRWDMGASNATFYLDRMNNPINFY